MVGMAPKVRQVKVHVPATSANLGSGFDTVGLALDYHDELTFTVTDGSAASAVAADTGVAADANGTGIARSGSDGATRGALGSGEGAGSVDFGFGNAHGSADTSAHVIIHGEGERTLPRDETHLVVSTFRRACRIFGLRRFGFTLEAWNAIPQARGMGSSAEAIVAGIAAAAAFAQGSADLNRNAIFDLAATIEGHPDNVAPAVYGGLTVSWDFETAEGVGSVAIDGAEPMQSGFHSVSYEVDSAIAVTIFIPDFELSTESARQAIPKKIAHKDAVFNVSRATLLPAAMNPNTVAWSGNVPTSSSSEALAKRSNQLLFAATEDRLHQAYRAALMPESAALIDKLRAQGFAAAVSGAGPCVLVLHYDDSGESAQRIDAVAAEELTGGHWRVLHLPVSSNGVVVELQ